jgi:signal transduction histidine kinase
VDDVAQVDVIDTGVGIAEEDQRFLFARFFRAIHNESTYDISGAGLGLYLSKAIIEAHHGEIWVQTELNKGSIFSFKLNLLKSPQANPVKTEILENEKVESSG